MTRTPPSDRFGSQNARRDRLEKDARDASRIDGAQFGLLFQKLTDLIANLNTTVTGLVSGLTYTRAQIDTSQADQNTVIAGKANSVHSHPESDVTGTWSKNVDNGTGGEVRTGTLYAAGAPTYNITGSRIAAWWETATGRAGYASSSRRHKTNIAPAGIDPLAVLSIESNVFEYIAQIAERERRAELPSPYADWNPDYPVAVETGFIAEDLADAGFGAPFTFARDGLVEGVEYSMWPVAQQAALRYLHEQLRAALGAIDTLTARVTDLEQNGTP